MNKLWIDGEDISLRGMIPTKIVIGAPKPATKYIEVPGRSGKIDVTDFIGLTHGNRTIEITVCVFDGSIYSTARRYLERLNGRNISLVISAAPDDEWRGRVTLKSYKRTGLNTCEAALSVDAEPWPYDVMTGEVDNV